MPFGAEGIGMEQERFALTASRGFESWLHRAGGAIGFTTYQAGKLFLLGLRATTGSGSSRGPSPAAWTCREQREPNPPACYPISTLPLR